jgi:hypothetical protein
MGNRVAEEKSFRNENRDKRAAGDNLKNEKCFFRNMIKIVIETSTREL